MGAGSGGELGAGVTADGVMSERRLRVATWNMDHWKRSVADRGAAWDYLDQRLGADIALMQECVPPTDMPRAQVAYREIGGRRPWGSAVAVLSDELTVEELGPVRTHHASTRFPLLGTYPGSIMVATVRDPEVGPITCVSVYGMIDVYAQTTMLRIVADLIPLFDSPHGARVLLGGDFNITTAVPPGHAYLKRYDAILEAVESLGLMNVVETAERRPGQLEGCLCGASSCHHLRTYGETPGSQLDWLFATPSLARRCREVRVDLDVLGSLSDHAPVVADFDVPMEVPDRKWDPESFVEEMATRAGPDAGRVAAEIVAWAQRRTEELQRRSDVRARIDRLPTSTGPDPELWVQLDLERPEGRVYTISLKADGRIVVQFQHMARPPFDSEEGRSKLWRQITEMQGVELDRRFNGRPTFPIEALAEGDNLERFLRILDDLVDEVVRHHVTRSQ